ncbi:MAG: DUF4936 family protein [Noviherbaspirillum sp.]
MDLYIYYKVAAEAAAELAGRVSALQAALAASHGVAVSLKRRPGAHDGLQTWMEVYAGVPEGFDAALAQAVAGSGIAGLIAGQRHTEIFVDIPPCA